MLPRLENLIKRFSSSAFFSALLAFFRSEYEAILFLVMSSLSSKHRTSQVFAAAHERWPVKALYSVNLSVGNLAFLSTALSISIGWSYWILGCPKMHPIGQTILTLCMWLCLYLKAHQKNLVSFHAIFGCGCRFLSNIQICFGHNFFDISPYTFIFHHIIRMGHLMK